MPHLLPRLSPGAQARGSSTNEGIGDIRLGAATIVATLAAFAAPIAGEARSLPPTRSWSVATYLADRVYPGVRSWLWRCSSTEGGHGGFVWNYGGSGSGGWMQFLRSTFDAYAWTALRDVQRRGWQLPGGVGYFDPLGQALVAGYMRSHGLSYHWDPRIDPNCA